MFLEIRGIKKSFGSGDSKVDVRHTLAAAPHLGRRTVLCGQEPGGTAVAY